MIKNHKLEELLNMKLLTDIHFNKEEYGEVLTPLSIINKMLDNIPEKIFEDPDKKWLDPGSGTGHFSIVLYFRLFNSLKIVDVNERHNHIINNMIYMVELQPQNVLILKKIFGSNANIYSMNFLNLHQNSNYNDITPEIYDVIIGNPPFNSQGLKKVPTNNFLNKKEDGKTIWSAFVIKAMGILKKTGILCFLIPSIWLKPDKNRMYYFLTQYDIKYLTCFSNTQTNKLFNGNAQTPSCFFILTKKSSNNIISIFDYSKNKYIDYPLKISLPIPLCGISILNKLYKYYINNPVKVLKTNLPSKDTILSAIKTDNTPNINITTCLLNRKTNVPILIYNYSNKLQVGANKPKLILAHKMYGFPYLDISGVYGVTNRDNYLIMKENIEDLIKLQKFLSTKTALYIFESTRYRMKYLEKYVFELIPDITNLIDFPREINDMTIAKYFNFDEEDINAIKNLHKKDYKFFI